MTSTAVEVRIEDVPIASIYREPNHRLKESIDKEALKSLAESMNAEGGETAGQQSAVRVHELPGGHTSAAGKPYVLAFGYRRMAAAEMLGWTTIKAEIRPPADSIQLETERALENLERQNLNTMEEVETVTAMLAAADGDADLVAARLGRSLKWVTDRSYLTRLFPKARKLVMEGTLLLGHARELAKIGDEHEQDRLASYAAEVDPSTGVVQRWTIDKVRQDVEKAQRSLKIVGWELDVPFAGKPACAGCPHNTKSDPVLFDGAGAGNDAGTCMNGSCFAAKTQAAVKARDAVAKKIAKAGTSALSAVREHLAAPGAGDGDGPGAYLKPAWVQREAKKRVEEASPKKKPRATASDLGSQKVSREQLAVNKWGKAFRRWRSAAVRRLVAAMTPAHVTGLMLFFDIPAAHRRDEAGITYQVYSYGRKEPVPFVPMAPRDVANLALALTDAVLPKPLETLAAAVHAYVQKGGYVTRGPLRDLVDCSPDLLQRMAGHLKVELDPVPDFEAILNPPSKAAAPRPAAKAAKPAKPAKKPSKKSGKKAVKA